MTQLTGKERKAQMADMKSFDEQMPCVGLFWYDPEEHSLSGVQKEEVTPLRIEKEAENGVRVICYPETAKEKDFEFQGRIIWHYDKFIVLVGKWAEPIQEKLTELLEKRVLAPIL